MKWIIYAAVLERFGKQFQQIRRAPITEGDNPNLAAERLGGYPLGVQETIRKAENFRRLIELQASAAGHEVVEWSAPEEWQQETPRSFAAPRLPVGKRYPFKARLSRHPRF